MLGWKQIDGTHHVIYFKPVSEQQASRSPLYEAVRERFLRVKRQEKAALTRERCGPPGSVLVQDAGKRGCGLSVQGAALFPLKNRVAFPPVIRENHGTVQDSLAVLVARNSEPNSKTSCDSFMSCGLCPGIQPFPCLDPLSLQM